MLSGGQEFLDLELQTGKQWEMQSRETQENAMAKKSTALQVIQSVVRVDQVEEMIAQGLEIYRDFARRKGSI